MRGVRTLMIIASVAATASALTAASRLVAQQDAAASQPRLTDVAWIAGSWFGQGLGGQVEEHWTEPSGGVMIGGFRLVARDRARVLEFLMITETEEGVFYRFKHFNPDYTTWEKNEPLIFRLIEASPGRAVFHSDVAEQHSPRRLEYVLLDDGGLRVTVFGSDQTTGELNDSLVITMRRPQ